MDAFNRYIDISKLHRLQCWHVVLKYLQFSFLLFRKAIGHSLTFLTESLYLLGCFFTMSLIAVRYSMAKLTTGSSSVMGKGMKELK